MLKIVVCKRLYDILVIFRLIWGHVFFPVIMKTIQMSEFLTSFPSKRFWRTLKTFEIHVIRWKLSSVLIPVHLQHGQWPDSRLTTWSYLDNMVTVCFLPGHSYQLARRSSTSAPCRLSTGVPQGPVLIRLLFSLYTCSLTSCYDDDPQLILSFPPIDTHVSTPSQHVWSTSL